MFKLIKAWWNSQFLTEGESQVVYQSDDSVKSLQCKSEESEQGVEEELTPIEKEIQEFGYVHALYDTYITLDTFTYVRRDTYLDGDSKVKWTIDNGYKPLDIPVVSILKLIKHHCEFGKFTSNGRSIKIEFGNIVITADIAFNTAHNIQLDVGVTSLLKPIELGAISGYVKHCLYEYIQKDNKLKREQMEQHLQSLLKEANE